MQIQITSQTLVAFLVNKLIILDRDGVINEDSETYIKTVDEWQPIPGSLEAIAALTQAGYTIAIATNQSGISRGYYDETTLHAMHAKMHTLLSPLGGKVDAIAFCPHQDQHDCTCRKPKPGMVTQLLEQFDANPEHTWLVGDSERDLIAGEAAGCKTILVRTGKGTRTDAKDRPVFDNLAAVAKALIAEIPS